MSDAPITSGRLTGTFPKGSGTGTATITGGTLTGTFPGEPGPQGPPGPPGPAGPPGPQGLPGTADPALEARVADLEARVAALEASSGVNPEPEPPPVEDVLSLDLVADFHADPTGVADARPALDAFNAHAVAHQGTGSVNLTIPAGTYKIASLGVDPYHGAFPFFGINNLVVNAYGAVFNHTEAGKQGMIFGAGAGEYQFNPGFTYSSRVNSVTAGTSSVTLKNSAEASHFSAGMWCRMSGLDLQGIWHNDNYGFPTNQHFFEFVQVQGVAGSVVTFTAPLINSYLDTWPNFNHGASDPYTDNAGPATLHILQQEWACTHVYNGLTSNYPATSQISCSGMSLTFNNCTFNGGAPYGISPTFNKLFRMNNCVCNASNFMEVDKSITDMIFDNCVLNGGMTVQSSSVDQITIQNNSDVAQMVGTAKRLVATNSRIRQLLPGPTVHGRADSVTCINCQIDLIGDNHTYHNVGYRFLGPGDVGVNNAWTITDGVIKIPNTDNASFNMVRWAVPGGYCFLGDLQHHFAGPIFKIVSVTQDATNCYVHTDQTWTGWPTMENGGTVYAIIPHPCPKATFTNCTGSPEAVSLSLAPAGAPLCQYHKLTFDGSMASWPFYPLWGSLVSVKVEVAKPATVAGAVTASPGFFHIIPPGPNYSESSYTATLDLKTAGTRILVPDTVSGTVGADSIKPPGPLILTGLSHIQMTDISAQPPEQWPSFTVEWITDQGIS